MLLKAFNRRKELATITAKAAMKNVFRFVKREPFTAVNKALSTWKDITAPRKVQRSGIPASITLAQGIHESSFGTSYLSKNTNNHFGIKCKSYWVGKTYYHKDDDMNDEGQLIESCFRSYGSALESYVDHSNFLMSTSHYLPLFNYEHTDYKSWANGLKSCGYATDQKYAQKLINKIEKYDLARFDAWENPYKRIMGN